MALVHCKECDGPVAATAERCGLCGIRNPGFDIGVFRRKYGRPYVDDSSGVTPGPQPTNEPVDQPDYLVPSGRGSGQWQLYRLRLSILDGDGMRLGPPREKDYIMLGPHFERIESEGRLTYYLPRSLVEYLDVSFLPWAREAIGGGPARLYVMELEGPGTFSPLVEVGSHMALIRDSDVEPFEPNGWTRDNIILSHDVGEGVPTTVPNSWVFS